MTPRSVQPEPEPREDPVDLRTIPLAAAAWIGALIGTSLSGRWGSGQSLSTPVIVLGTTTVAAALASVWAVRGRYRSPPTMRRHRGNGLDAAAAGGRGERTRPASGRDRRAVWAVLAALVCLLAGMIVGAVRSATAHAGPVASLAADRAVVTAEIVLVADPVRREGGAGRQPYVVARARLASVTGRGTTTLLRSPVLVVAADPAWLDVLPGQRVASPGRLAPVERGPEVALLRVDGPPQEPREATVAGVYAAAEPLRRGLRDAVSGLPPGPRGLVPALVVGDERQMPEQLRDDMRATGLTHLTAVSGANVAIVLAAVLGVARWVGLRSYGLPVLGALAVTAFVVLARPQPSVVRAAAMGVVGICALAAGGRRRGTATLGSAVLLLVLVDPWLSRSPGFALSVFATAGILVLAPGWRDALPWMPRPVAEGLAVPLAAQVACTPVLVVLADEASLASLPANMLAAPAVAPATVLGVAAAVASTVTPAGAALLAHPAGWSAWWIVEVAERGADLPGATTAWPAGAHGVLLAMAASALAVIVVPHLLRRRALAGALAVLLAIVLVRPPVPGWPPDGWVVAACAVGQGDALAVRSGPGVAVVVDAGPDPAAVDRCLDRLGVREVPVVVLTHFHADHVLGLPGVLAGRRVGLLLVSPLREPVEQVRRVDAWARSAGIPVRVAAAGERRVVGTGERRVAWDVLWPRRLLTAEGSPANNASVVIRAEVGGVRLLLTGDAEPAAQRALLRSTEDLRAEVLKVPHHGSAYQEPEFLAAVGARVALVTAGEYNTYGHPAESTLHLLDSIGTHVWRTDSDGSVAVTSLSSGGLGVVAGGPRPRTR